MIAEQTIEFAKGCAESGLCPRCINMGESNDNDIDLLGVCRNCGYANAYFTPWLKSKRKVEQK